MTRSQTERSRTRHDLRETVAMRRHVGKCKEPRAPLPPFSSSPSPFPSSSLTRNPITSVTMVNSSLETRTLIDEFRDFEKGWLFDLGHPLLNRIAESFVKAAGIGAMQAVSREAYFTAIESDGFDSGLPPELSTGPGSGSKKQRRRFPNLRGETNSKSLEALVKSTGKESLQWGLAAGIYSGLTYGLREARGSHDWKNSAVAGALTGMTVALTSDDVTHEQVVQFAITGAAISTAANLLSGIF